MGCSASEPMKTEAHAAEEVEADVTRASPERQTITDSASASANPLTLAALMGASGETNPGLERHHHIAAWCEEISHLTSTVQTLDGAEADTVAEAAASSPNTTPRSATSRFTRGGAPGSGPAPAAGFDADQSRFLSHAYRRRRYGDSIPTPSQQR